MSKLKKVYQEIKDLDLTDECSISEAVCKFVEESGEMVREINKTTGRKILLDWEKDSIKGNIREEAADTLQNLLLICGRFDIDIDDLLKEVRKKNKKWEKMIPKRQEQRKKIKL